MIISAIKGRIQKPAKSWLCVPCRQRQTILTDSASGSTVKGRQLYQGDTASIRQYASAAIDSSQHAQRRNERLPDSPARTRFAPSPTGYMHIGGLRTALFSYLLAKRTNGQFILRIEDTDQTRLVPDAEERLCEDLRWAGLHWDEGPEVKGPFGSYRQSERSHVYQKYARQLIDTDAAYRCFCTPQIRRGIESAIATSACYQDCSSLPSAQAQERAELKQELFTVRLKQPAHVQNRVYPDLIYGKIPRLKRRSHTDPGDENDSGNDAADTILVKSDGVPTYHFANVVDDHLMQITHVIRGSEWMASTPLHYDLYAAFNWKPPAFAHVGLLVDANKAKLSKRSNTGLVLDVKGMRAQEGILPEVLCNFLALMGWSNPRNEDVLDMNELIHNFDLKFTKGNTMVRMEKLWFLQKQHVARRREQALSRQSRAPLADIAKSVSDAVRHAYPDAHSHNALGYKCLEEFCADLLLVDFNSYKTPKQFVERNRYFFTYNVSEVPEERDLYGESPDISGADVFEFLQDLMARVDVAPADSTTSLAPRDATAGKMETPKTTSPLDFIEQKTTRINAAIELEIEKKVSRKVGPHQAVNHTSDAEAPAEALLRQHKVWKQALMRYLREKLSYGLPGPSVGHVMALLGYEECCRRLGVKPKKDKGW